MNTKRILGLGFLVVLSACKGECSCGTDSDDDDGTGVGGAGGSGVTVTVGSTTQGSGGAGGGTGGETSAGGAGTGGEAPIIDPQVRFVNVALNTTEVNFCLKRDNGDLVGPLETDLGFPDYSSYSDIPVGNYGGVLIPAGAACDDADAVSFDELPYDGDGSAFTLALIGDADDEVELVRFDDDLTYPAAGNTRLRFAHAVNVGPVDIASKDANGEYVYLLQGVDYGTAVYTDEIPAFPATSLFAVSGPNEFEVPDVVGTDSAIVTAFSVGSLADGLSALIITDAAP